MHEYYDVEQYYRFLTVQAQAAFFIIAYHGYMGVRSLWQTALAVVILAWLFDEITHVSTMVAAVMGLALALTIRTHRDTIHYHQVFYFLVQPAVLHAVLPLYVEQTMYPVGVPLAFIAWLGMNIILWAFSDHHKRFRMAVAVPVVTVLFFSWLLDKHPWIPVSVATGVGALYSIMLASAKKTREK